MFITPAPFLGERKYMKIKHLLQSLALVTGLILASHSFAQTPPAPAKPAAVAPAPAPATVQTAAPAPAVAAPATSAIAAKKGAYKVPDTAAAGGGNGKVWVNSASKVYHCPGTKYYGKTKAGEYMNEADAKAAGNHPVNKKACS
jgi:hypothetical protein